MSPNRSWIVVAFCWLACCGVALGQIKPAKLQRWVYLPTNLLVGENVDKLEKIFRTAAKNGYTHVNVSDTKFCRLEEMPKHYFANVERVKSLAKELKLEIVPGIFPIGWSAALLQNDPNLAEGLPVRDALFVVKDGEASLVADPPVSLRGGDMENLNKWSYHDETVVADSGAARISNSAGKNSRLSQTIKVSPFRQYHVSVRFKTKDFKGTPEIKAIGNGQVLNYNHLDVKPTQDWTVHHTVFNSLENAEVGIYMGAWGGGKGTLWIDDATIEEVGLLNVLRRPGAPLVVKRDGTADASPLVEGKDFEPIADPRMGVIPWKGEFEVWHTPPTIRTKLANGTKLRVSYYHPMVIYGGSVMISLAEPKTMELLKDHAERVHKMFGAKGYFMNHDEMRVFNWDQVSMDLKLDAGELLARHIKACIKILKDVNPGGRIYVWGDMFDPHHNAVDKYYLVRGNIAGSWKGLDPSVIIVNWNYGKRDQSLKFFADRGHQQLIAGYYDGPLEHARNWIDSAAKSNGVVGFMYTTWNNDYTKLDKLAEELEK